MDNHVALIDRREIPLTDQRGPVLSYLTESAPYYFDLICDSARYLKDVPGGATEHD